MASFKGRHSQASLAHKSDDTGTLVCYAAGIALATRKNEVDCFFFFFFLSGFVLHFVSLKKGNVDFSVEKLSSSQAARTTDRF